MRRSLFLLALFLACVQPLHAQLQVGLEIKRRFFMLYEPIVATVTIKNLAGRDVTLADSPTQSWFGFQINRADGQIVPPLDPNYQLSPLTIPAGETVKRSVILNSLYPVRELGMFRMRATIYFAVLDKYYQSQAVNIELSEGKTVWQQTVGVPDGAQGAGSTRKFSLLFFRQSEYSYLYLRVEDLDAGTVYTTMSLGRVIAGQEPETQTDIQNTLHILQVAGPKTYLYSHVGTNGELLAQNNYHSTKARPTLHRDAAGIVTVVGGELQVDTEAAGKTGKIPNKLSDKPVQIPKE